jgi:hypothetical protein
LQEIDDVQVRVHHQAHNLVFIAMNIKAKEIPLPWLIDSMHMMRHGQPSFTFELQVSLHLHLQDILCQFVEMIIMTMLIYNPY